MANVIRKHMSRWDVLKLICNQGTNYGFGSEETRTENSRKTVVVEYSSPNIAKPFHVGHLRSTITGNVIANLYERLGWKVVRLNYLGDWGTQFGLLLVGYQKYGNQENLKTNALEHLYEVYVQINKDIEKKTTQTQSTVGAQVHKEALEWFRRLENGDRESLGLWQQFRDISLSEYCKLYERLGISFTEHHAESMYNTQSLALIEQMKIDGIVKTDENGTEYIDVGNEKEHKVIVRKSDGTSLYITRDMAALMDRYQKYKFNKIHYVAGSSQKDHFKNLHKILSKLPQWNERLLSDLHLGFGNITGMRTRQGNVVFLKSVLDEAHDRMMKSMLKAKTTKVQENMEQVADILGCSAVIVQNVSMKREVNYKFSWDRVLHTKQDSGVFMQYCHSRLCSIERNSNHSEHIIDSNADEYYLNKEEAVKLIDHLARFEESVDVALSTLEPYFITRYLFDLCHLVNAAYRTCSVLNAEPDEGQAHLQMFRASRKVLSSGMTLLGLTPLEKM